MKERTVKRYLCDHCGKGFWNTEQTQWHEITCVFNPDRSCKMGWVSVTDKLPDEDGQFYLVAYHVDPPRPDKRHRCGVFRWSGGSWKLDAVYKVTHWMEIEYPDEYMDRVEAER